MSRAKVERQHAAIPASEMAAPFTFWFKKKAYQVSQESIHERQATQAESCTQLSYKVPDSFPPAIVDSFISWINGEPLVLSEDNVAFLAQLARYLRFPTLELECLAFRGHKDDQEEDEEGETTDEKKIAEEKRIAEVKRATDQRRISELCLAYSEPANQATNILSEARDSIARPDSPSDKLAVRLAGAQVAVTTRVAAPLRDADRIWTEITQLARSSGLTIPAVERRLEINELRRLRSQAQSEIERRTTELESQAPDSEGRTARAQIAQWAGMLNERQRISGEMEVCGGKMSRDVPLLNPNLDASTQARIQQDIQRRAKNGCQVLTDLSQTARRSDEIEQSIVTALIPNLAVRADVARRSADDRGNGRDS
jgi:hypothetical protein